MTPEQLAKYRTLLANGMSARGERDPKRFIFLRGWNAGIQFAEEMLNKAMAEAVTTGQATTHTYVDDAGIIQTENVDPSA